MIIPVMLFRSYAERLSPTQAVAFIKNDMETVENCIECGICATKCLYHLPIPEMMKDHYAYYQEIIAGKADDSAGCPH